MEIPIGACDQEPCQATTLNTQSLGLPPGFGIYAGRHEV